MGADRRPPDCVGYTLEDAREMLREVRWTAVEVVETRPPRRQLRPPQRVVRQRLSPGDRLQLIACGERAEDPAG